jgi:hypothetical protein
MADDFDFRGMSFKDALTATLADMDKAKASPGVDATPAIDTPGLSFKDALSATLADMDAANGGPPQAPAPPTPSAPSPPSLVSPEEGAAIDKNIKEVGGVLSSIGLGAASAGIELKDFIFGEPKQQDKWSVRTYTEERLKDLKRENVVNGIAATITQFGVGFIGLGKVKWIAQGSEWAARTFKGGRFVADTTRGAVTGGVFMDPHEERLSNLVESYPSLRNPITNYLAARPEDANAEGRLKNALEGIVMDTVLVGALAAVAKGIKLYRAGDLKGANEAAAEADEMFARSAREGSIDEGGKAHALRREMEAMAGRADESEVPGAGVEMPLEGKAGAIQREMQGGTDPLGDEFPGGLPRDSDGSTLRQAGEESADADLVSRRLSEDNLRSRLGGGEVRTSSPESGPSMASAGRFPSRSGAHSAGVDGSGAAYPAHGGGGGMRGSDSATPPEQLTKLLDRARADHDALIQHGSREAAIDAGHVFAGSRETGLIPWQKLRTTDETRAWMERAIDEQASLINTVRGGDAKGILSDNAVEKMVADRAATWREDPAELMGALTAAGDQAPQLAANMETSFLIANRAFQDAYELAVRINSENYTGFGSRGEALATLQQRMAMATAMYANGKAIVSNSARTLRRMRGEFRITDEQLANIQTADPEALKNIVAATGGNPRALADAGRISAVRRITDEVAALHAGNLLWGWKTQVINFATSAAQLVWRPLEVNVGAAVLRRTILRGDEARLREAETLRRQTVREVTYLGSVLSDGWNAAVRAWIEGDSALIPHKQEAFNVAGGGGSNHIREIVPDYRFIRSVDDLAHNALESWTALKGATGLSLRTLGAADEMVKTMRYRAIVLAKADLEAESRGLVRGSQDFNAYVSQRLDDAFDDLGRGTDAQALEEAKASTFQQDLPTDDQTWIGSWSRSYSAGVTKAPLLRLITPFIKTPTNLMRYGVKLTPGLNLLQREYFHALSGGAGLEAQARATGQMSLGLMLTGIALTLWAKGSLVGAGPQNPQQRKQWLAQGNRPNSLTWTDDEGRRHFLELNRFDPINMPFLIVADAASILTAGHMREEDEQGLAMSVVLALAHIVRDKTYLRGISDAVQAFTDDRKLSTFPQRFAPGFLPFSSLLSSVNPDPVLHEVRDVADAMLAKIPGFSATLPPQRDFLGEIALAPNGFTSAQKNTGPLSRELDQMFAVTGTYISAPAARGASTGGVDLRDFTLKKSGRTAYDRYQELAGRPDPGGLTLKEALTKIVQHRDFQALPHGPATVEGTRESAIMGVVSDYRREAWRLMMAENEDLRDAVYKQRRAVNATITENMKSLKGAADKARLDSAAKLLKSYGIDAGNLTPH